MMLRNHFVFLGILILYPIVLSKSLNLIEGDILIPENDSVEHFLSDLKISRSSVLDRSILWTNGTVHYLFRKNHFTEDEISLIKNSMKIIEGVSCIRFVETNNESENYILYIKGGGCYSSVGMTGNQQTVSIGYGCLSTGTIIHELYHALGFYHEQSRRDRDDYVNIYWENIIPGLEYNFIKYNTQNLTPYDYKSLMHYDNLAFSVDWIKKTIVAKDGTPLLHSSIKKTPSPYDIKKLNVLYKCHENICVDKHPNCEDWFRNKNTKCDNTFFEVACPLSCSKNRKTACDPDKLLKKDFSIRCNSWRKDCMNEYVKYVCLFTCS